MSCDLKLAVSRSRLSVLYGANLFIIFSEEIHIIFVYISMALTEHECMFECCAASTRHEGGTDSHTSLLVSDLPRQPIHPQILSDTGNDSSISVFLSLLGQLLLVAKPVILKNLLTKIDVLMTLFCIR